MELADNLKLRLDQGSGGTQQDRLVRPPETEVSDTSAPIDEAESQMRKALGLLGDTPRHRPDQDRMEQPNRMGDRFGGGLHRRRFVQDGDIPVTVLRRDQAHDVPAHRGAAPASTPSSSRLQRTEAALANETAAREKAERTLAETQAVVRDLQTKIGHSELAKVEAADALRIEREVNLQFRAEVQGWEDRLRDAQARIRSAEEAAASYQEQLAEERHSRKIAEKALHVAEAARMAAEQIAATLSEEAAKSRHVAVTGRAAAVPELTPAPTRRRRVPEVPVDEPEPVKWWLNSKPASKRR